MATSATVDAGFEWFLHDAVAYVIPCPELSERNVRKRMSGAECSEILEGLKLSESKEEGSSQTPTSFVAALKQKYCYSELVAHADAASHNIVTDFVTIRSPRRRRVSQASSSADNLEDDAVLGHLISVSFTGIPLTSVGDVPPNGLVALCPNVSELDLTNTGLCDWNSILDIFSALPKLTRANLSRNLLGSTEGIAVPKRLPFPRLNFLELTDTKLEWPDLQNIGKWFPFIKHLQVCCNSLSCLCSEALVYFQHLETLLLNGNHIEDWNQVWKLSSLPRLETLVLSGNPLGSISYNKLNPLLPDFVPLAAQPSPTAPYADCRGSARALHFDAAPTQCAPFASLTTLTLTDTALNCWTDLQALRQFPKLDNVRLKGIPLLDQISVSDRRGFCIACLPNVASVNGSPVNEEERLKCESFFIRHFSTLDSCQRPLRHHELVSIHGDLMPLVDVHLGLKESERLKVFTRGRWLFSLDVKLSDPEQMLFQVLAKKLKCRPHVLRIFQSRKAPGAEEATLDEIFDGRLPLSRYDFQEDDSLVIDGDFDLPEQIDTAIEAQLHEEQLHQKQSDEQLQQKQ